MPVWSSLLKYKKYVSFNSDLHGSLQQKCQKIIISHTSIHEKVWRPFKANILQQVTGMFIFPKCFQPFKKLTIFSAGLNMWSANAFNLHKF